MKNPSFIYKYGPAVVVESRLYHDVYIHTAQAAVFTTFPKLLRNCHACEDACKLDEKYLEYRIVFSATRVGKGEE